MAWLLRPWVMVADGLSRSAAEAEKVSIRTPVVKCEAAGGESSLDSPRGYRTYRDQQC